MGFACLVWAMSLASENREGNFLVTALVSDVSFNSAFMVSYRAGSMELVKACPGKSESAKSGSYIACFAMSRLCHAFRQKCALRTFQGLLSTRESDRRNDDWLIHSRWWQCLKGQDFITFNLRILDPQRSSHDGEDNEDDASRDCEMGTRGAN